MLNCHEKLKHSRFKLKTVETLSVTWLPKYDMVSTPHHSYHFPSQIHKKNVGALKINNFFKNKILRARN